MSATISLSDPWAPCCYPLKSLFSLRCHSSLPFLLEGRDPLPSLQVLGGLNTLVFSECLGPSVNYVQEAVLRGGLQAEPSWHRSCGSTSYQLWGLGPVLSPQTLDLLVWKMELGAGTTGVSTGKKSEGPAC